MSKQTDLINIPDAITVDGTKVGIGTTSPTLPLDIVSNAAADALKIRARPTSDDYGTLTFYNNAGTTKWADIQSNVAKDLRFYTNGGLERIRITSSGNLMLDPNSVGNKYARFGTSSTGDGHILLDRGGAHKWQITSGLTNALQFHNYTAGSESMRIDGSGRVTTPSQPSFRAFKSSSQTAGSANETVTWNATYHNVGNHFNTTSGTFTAPVAGAYQFALTCLTPNAANTLNLHITLNGSNNNGVRMRVAQANGHTTGCVTGVLNLNSSDYVQVRLENQGGQLYGDASQSWTTFSGHLLG